MNASKIRLIAILGGLVVCGGLSELRAGKPAPPPPPPRRLISSDGSVDLYVANVTTVPESGPVDAANALRIYQHVPNYLGVDSLKWSPPGAAQQRLAFAANFHLYVISFDGSGMTDLVPRDVMGLMGIAWSLDGNYLVYTAQILPRNLFKGRQYQITRIKLSDHSTVQLTSDISDTAASKFTYGWCP